VKAGETGRRPRRRRRPTDNRKEKAGGKVVVGCGRGGDAAGEEVNLQPMRRRGHFVRGNWVKEEEEEEEAGELGRRRIAKFPPSPRDSPPFRVLAHILPFALVHGNNSRALSQSHPLLRMSWPHAFLPIFPIPQVCHGLNQFLRLPSSFFLLPHSSFLLPPSFFIIITLLSLPFEFIHPFLYL
jgi:hypothetical protein